MTDTTRKMSQSEKILMAAFKCISSKGYANVSLRDIAKEAGVALSQLNYYYKNKEGLFSEVVKKMIEKYLVEVEKCLNKDVSPKEKLRSLIKYFQDLLKYDPELFKLLFDFTGLSLWSSNFSCLLNNFFKEFSNMIEKFILNNIQTKELRGYSPRDLSRLILGAMFGTSIQVLLDKEDELPETLNIMQILFE